MMLLGRTLSRALEELFGKRAVHLDDLTDALHLLEIVGPLGRLSCDGDHWVVSLRPSPEPPVPEGPRDAGGGGEPR